MGIISRITNLFKSNACRSELAAIEGLTAENKQLKSDVEYVNFILKSSDETIDSLKNEIEELMDVDTKLEKFCKARYVQIGNMAYKHKRSIDDVSYSIFLNELVTPLSWEVQNLMRNYNLKYKDNITRAKIIGDRIGGILTWDDDHNLATSGDYYLYPNETISRKLGDCEDHAFVAMSCHPEMGGAWGFFVDQQKNEYGHAFNCFVHEDKLYVLDTVGNSASIVEYVKNTCGYRIHYIITSKYTFMLETGVIFGELAGWTE